MRIGIRTQLISYSVGVIIAIAVILTAVSLLILSRTLSSQVKERTKGIAAVVQGELDLRQRDLERIVELEANNGQFVNDVHYQQWHDVENDIEAVRKEKHVALAIVFDPEGVPQAAAGIPLDKAAPFGKARARLALTRSAVQSLIEPFNGHMYIVACAKVQNFGLERGDLMMFQTFDDAAAAELRKKVGAQIIAFTADGPVAASIPLSKKLTEKLSSSFASLAEDPLVALGSISANEETFFTMAFPLSTTPSSRVKAIAPSGAIAYAIPERDIDVAQRRTLLGSVGFAVVLTLVVGLLALALANQIARPIAAMAEQFSRISASGDLSLRVQENLDNEIGDMARSFNGMQQRVEQLHGRVVMAEDRMRKELQMASTVQSMLFQQDMPHNRACEVAAYTSTLVETSGDWYAVFDDLDAKRTIFVIADATGHGASAALLTAITHGFFQTMWTAKQGGDAALSRIPPSTILAMLNSVVLNSAHGTITATVFVGVLHHGSRKMVYSSAGHIPPIVTRWEENEMKANILTCNPSSSIGSAEKPVYEDYTVELPHDSIVLIYTDGLTEVENPQGMQWGVRKLISVLRGCRTDTVEGVRQKVLDSCMQFARGKELMDDMTYLTVRVL